MQIRTDTKSLETICDFVAIARKLAINYSRAVAAQRPRGRRGCCGWVSRQFADRHLLRFRERAIWLG